MSKPCPSCYVLHTPDKCPMVEAASARASRQAEVAEAVREMESRPRRITGDTTLAELQSMIEEAGIRIKMSSTRLDENHKESMSGETLFSVDDFTHVGGPYPSRCGVLMSDLAEAIDEAVYLEMYKRSLAGLELLRLFDSVEKAVEGEEDEPAPFIRGGRDTSPFADRNAPFKNSFDDGVRQHEQALVDSNGDELEALELINKRREIERGGGGHDFDLAPLTSLPVPEFLKLPGWTVTVYRKNKIGKRESLVIICMRGSGDFIREEWQVNEDFVRDGYDPCVTSPEKVELLAKNALRRMQEPVGGVDYGWVGGPVKIDQFIRHSMGRRHRR